MPDKKLKPCPLCEGAAYIRKREFNNPYCGCCSHCGAESGQFSTREQAVAAWNTRPVEDELLAALKIARANLQFLPPDDIVAQIDAALAKAEGRP